MIFLLATPLVLIAGLRPVGFDPDSQNYAALIGHDLGELRFGAREPTFWIISWLSGQSFINSIRSFFLIYALLGVGVKCAAIATQSQKVLLSLFLYLMLYFVPHEMTQIRVGVAAGIYLFALNSLARGDRISFIFRLFVAVCFHYSAIMGLLMLIFRQAKPTKLFLVSLPVLGMLCSLLLTPSVLENLGTWLLPGPIQGRLFIYIELLTEDRFSSINVFNPVTLSFLALFWILAARIPSNAGAFNRLLILSLGLGLASFYAFSFIPVMAFRIMEFLSVGIIILAANATHWWRDKQLWVTLVVVWAIAVFIAQTLMASLGVF